MDDEKLNLVYNELLKSEPQLKDFPPEEVKSRIRQRVEQRAKTKDPAREARRQDSLAKVDKARADIAGEESRGFGNKALGFAQGLTAGAMPTLAGLETILPGGAQLPTPDTGKGFFEDLKAKYLRERDGVLRWDERAEEETPGYLATKGMGQIASSFIPGGAAANTAKAGVTGAKAALAAGKAAAGAGALQGGVSGALSSDNAEQGSFMDLSQLAADTIIPTVAGGLLGGVGGAGVGYLGSKMVNKGPMSRLAGIETTKAENVSKPMGARVKGLGELIGGKKKEGIRGLVGDLIDNVGSKMERGRTSHIFAEDVDPSQMTRIDADVSAYQNPKATYAEDAAAFLERGDDVMSRTPDELTAYNTGNKLDVDPNDYVDPFAKTKLTEALPKKPEGQFSGSVISDRRGLQMEDGSWGDPRGFDDLADEVQIGTGADRPSALKLKDMKQDINSNVKSVAATPSAKAKVSDELPELEGPKTEPEKSGIREIQNLAQFRNEFRGQTKNMSPEDIKDAFPSDKRIDVAEAGKAFAMGGKKFLDAFEGNEIKAAEYALSNNLVQSIDDLVKILNMKGAGSRMDAKNIAQNLGYPDLPTVAPGSSRARKKSASEKLTKKKGP